MYNPDPTFIAVTYYTRETPYEDVVKGYFVDSAIAQGVPHVVYDYAHQGTWKKNVALKPKAILRAMVEHPDKHVVFVDADGKFERYPMLFDTLPMEPYDVAAHFLNWNDWYGYDDTPPHKEMLAGTMWFRNSTANVSLVQQWADGCAVLGWRDLDQKIFLGHASNADVKMANLPISYCWIATMPDGSPPKPPKPNPLYITHHQVSRALHASVGSVRVD